MATECHGYLASAISTEPVSQIAAAVRGGRIRVPTEWVGAFATAAAPPSAGPVCKLSPKVSCVPLNAVQRGHAGDLCRFEPDRIGPAKAFTGHWAKGLSSLLDKQVLPWLP